MSDYFFGITDPGKVRDNNEDAYLTVQLEEAHVLAAVIDGVGGYEGGEIAAAIAKDCIAELAAGKALDDAATALREAVIEVNRRIIEARKTQAGMEQMACVLTLALADAAANEFHYAHVGDTRLYLLRGTSLVKVSKDHSFVGFLEESNRITEMDAMRHPKRNEVNKVLGVDPNISAQQDYIDTGSSPFLPGDTLLLCSDGLTDMIGSREITDVLAGSGDVRGKAEALVDAANRAGGKDNVTVVLVQHPKVPAMYEPTLPAAKKSAAPIATPAPVATVPPRTATNPIVWILLLVCLGLAGTLVWQYLRSNSRPIATVAPPAEQPDVAPRQRDAAEQQLLAQLSQSGDSLSVDSSLAGSGVLLSDSLVLDKDTFRISGNGLVLRPDSSMHGPAILIPPSVAYVVLENMVFENFQTAIVVNGAILKLHNVRFRNCGTSVSYAFRFPDTTDVSGLIRQSAFFKTDSTQRGR